MTDPDGLHALIELQHALLELRGTVKHVGKHFERPSPVAHRVVIEGLDDGGITGEIFGRDGLLDLLVRQQLPGQAACKHGEWVGFERQGHVWRFKNVAADFGHEILVLGGACERQYLAAAHRMPHEEERHLAGEFRSYDFNNVGQDLRCGTRKALIGILLYGLTKATLVKADDKNAPAGESWEQLVVAITVVRETMDEDELCDRVASGLCED